MSREMEDMTIDFMADKAMGKVVFAEINADFLDVLFSFLSVRFGTIYAIHDRKSNIGCIDRLNQSATDLQKYLKPPTYDTFLLRDFLGHNTRIGKYYCFCQKYAPTISNGRAICNCGIVYDVTKQNCVIKKAEQHQPQQDCGIVCGGDELWFLKKDSSKFVITDELVVKPITRNSSTFSMLSSIGVHLVGNNSNLKRVTVTVKHDQVVHLFKRCLVSVTPLSDVFLPLVPTEDHHKPKIANHIKTRSAATCTVSQQRAIEPISHGKNITIKLICDKINKRVLFAEAKEDFVDLLFVFPHCSLRNLVYSLLDRCPFTSLYNLYQSARDLDVDNYYMSVKHKSYFCDGIDLTDCFEAKAISDSYRHYVDREGLFIVTDDLQVTPFSLTSTIEMFGKFDTSMTEIEERVVTVDKEKAMKLLMGFLASKMVLTYAFL